MTAQERARKMIDGMRADGWDVSALESLLSAHSVMLDALTTISSAFGTAPIYHRIAREAVEQVRNAEKVRKGNE